MTLTDLGRFGKFHAVASSDLPPGIVYVFQPAAISRQLGLWPYSRGPVFRIDTRTARQRRRGTGPQTDDMRQMIEDLQR